MLLRSGRRRTMGVYPQTPCSAARSEQSRRAAEGRILPMVELPEEAPGRRQVTDPPLVGTTGLDEVIVRPDILWRSPAVG